MAQTLTHTHPVSLKTAPAPEPSGVGIRLLDIPAATQNDPRARSYIVDRLAPGITIERRIQAQNNSNSAQSVRIYPGAAIIKDGSFTGGNDSAAVTTPTTTTGLDATEAPTSLTITAVTGNNSVSWNPTLTVVVPSETLVNTFTGTVTQSVA